MGTDGTDLIGHAPALAPIQDAGFMGSAAKLGFDIANDKDAFDVTLDSVAVGLDLLGAVLDPMGSVFGAVTGLIVDLVPPLKWFVDVLEGDPAAIAGVGLTWQNIGNQLITCGNEYHKSVSALDAQAWDTVAAGAYRATAQGYIECLNGVGSYSYIVSDGVIACGCICATARKNFFSALSDLVLEWVIEGLVALANAGWTFGGSIAAFLVAAEVEGALTGVSFASKLSALLTRLAAIGRKIGINVSKLDSMAAELKSFTGSATKSAESISGQVGKLKGGDNLATGLGSDIAALRKTLKSDSPLLQLKKFLGDAKTDATNAKKLITPLTKLDDQQMS